MRRSWLHRLRKTHDEKTWPQACPMTYGGFPAKCLTLEVRAFWRAALAWENGNGDCGHPFPRLLRFTLLTATRREEAARMLWSEIDNDDFSVWVIPAARYKTKIDFEVPLSGKALGILHEARRIKLGTAGYVFTTSGETPISGFSKMESTL
jgi:integrase